MRLTIPLFAVALMAVPCWGQMPNPAQTVNNVRNQLRSATNAVNQRHEAVAQAPTAKPAPASQRNASPKPTVRQMEVTKSKPASQAKSAAAEPKSAAVTIQARGKRDPFVSIIRTQSATGGRCATGKSCLAIGDIALKGIVRSEAGMIAVVENGERKTYFLHENDPVFNGHVVKIDPDGIVFRETVIDRVGHQSTREVVKRILKPSIS
jgi:Tfp pilus assembly protein PilP